MVRETVEQMRFATKLKTVFLSAVLLGVSALAGQAATINGVFSLSGTSFNEPGLVVTTSTRSGSFQVQLNVGQSATVDLFNIWTTENRVNGNNARQSVLQAAFTFASLGASGTANGVTQGNGTTAQFGSVNWGSPILVSFGNGGLLSLALNDASFSAGTNRLTSGPANGATIRATATLISAAVPVPASGLMLAGALAGGAAWARRRKRAV